MTVMVDTSAVAPLMAGLFASFGTKLGWITPTLWQHQTAFNDITEGDNGVYRAVRGPDACSGIGSPIGTRLAALFTNPAQAQAIRITGIQADNAMHRGQ